MQCKAGVVGMLCLCQLIAAKTSRSDFLQDRSSESACDGGILAQLSNHRNRCCLSILSVMRIQPVV